MGSEEFSHFFRFCFSFFFAFSSPFLVFLRFSLFFFVFFVFLRFSSLFSDSLRGEGKRLQFTAKMRNFTPTPSAPTPRKTSRSCQCLFDLGGGSKPRRNPYLTRFADIQGGMATRQESLDVIPQTLPNMATLRRKARTFIPKAPKTTKPRLWAHCSWKAIFGESSKYHSFRNHYILNSKTIKSCNCHGRKLLRIPEANYFL